MKTVHLHGQLGKRFGAKWKLQAKTTAEILNALEANNEGFYNYIVQKEFQENQKYYILTKKPELITTKEELESSFIDQNKLLNSFDSEEVHIVPAAEGGALITGLVIGAAAAAAFAVGAISATVALMIGSIAIGFITQGLTKPPEQPKPPDSVASKSFLMKGAQTRKSQGVPIPIGYGRLRVGATNISESSTCKRFTGNSSKKEVLESFEERSFVDVICEGPIEGFVSANGVRLNLEEKPDDIFEAIYINDTPIRNQKKADGSDGTYNYIINEKQDLDQGMPKFNLGGRDNNVVLSETCDTIFNYERMLYGVRPYGKHADRQNLKSDFSVDQIIKEGDSSPGSHTISSPYVSALTISLRGVVYKTNTSSGDNESDILRFAIMVVRDGKEYNVLDPASNCEIYPGSSKKIPPVASSVEQTLMTNIFPQALSSMGWLASFIGAGVCLGVGLDLGSILGGFGGCSLAMALFTPISSSIHRGPLGLNFGVEAVGDWKNAFFELGGIATSPYQFDIPIGFVRAQSKNITFKVYKLSCELDKASKDGQVGGQNRSRDLSFQHVVEHVPAKLRYPNVATCKTFIDSKNFSSTPDRSFHVKLRKVLVPSNYDPETREYNIGSSQRSSVITEFEGDEVPWNGLFKGQEVSAGNIQSLESLSYISDSAKEWTDNPAWVFYDLLRDPICGLGKYGITEDSIDKWQLYKIAKYCDELVETHYPVETDNGYPRFFSCAKGSKIITLDIDQYLANKIDTNASTNEYEVLNPTDVITPERFKELFKREFGDGEQYKGKPLALFLNSDYDEPTQDRKKKAALRRGKYKIKQRYITKTSFSDSYLRIEINQPISNREDSYGACACQINHKIVEPRFTANLLITERNEALKIIEHMTSIFRGMIAYSSGKIFATQDAYGLPSILFNNSNVASKGFTYTGVNKNKRISTVSVRFNNEEKNYKPDMIYEEDLSAINKFGLVTKDVSGFGITSPTQARRLALWYLYTSQNETEAVQFNAGKECSLLGVGSLFQVADELRSANVRSGRILSIGNSFVYSSGGKEFTENTYYVEIDKSANNNPVLGSVDLVVAAGQRTSDTENIELRSKFENSSEKQDAEINAIYTPQYFVFEGSMGMVQKGSHTNFDEFKTIVFDLHAKFRFDIDLEKNIFELYDNKFNINDPVVFSSDGSLPAGLSSDKIYYISKVNSDDHFFKVSESPGGDTIEIYNKGLDFYGQPGGTHYIRMNKDPDATDRVTQECMKEISIGSPFSMVGRMIQQKDQEVEEDKYQRLKLDKSVNSFFHFHFSNIFNYVNLKTAGTGWIWAMGFDEWVYAGEMLNESSNWIWFESMGWCWVNEVADKIHTMYIHREEKWMYIYGENSSEYRLFLLDATADSNKVGEVGYLGGESSTSGRKKKFFIQKADQGFGYFISIWGMRSQDTQKLIDEAQDWESPQGSTFEAPESPDMISTVINKIEVVEPSNAVQSTKALRIFIQDVDSKRISKYKNFQISDIESSSQDFNNALGGSWEIIFLGNGQIELINSESVAGFAEGGNFTFTSAKVSYQGEFDGMNIASIAPQTYRLISKKEVEPGSYEIIGLEYNQQKFEAIEKRSQIIRPYTPMPPQADLTKPDAPTNLSVTSTT